MMKPATDQSISHERPGSALSQIAFQIQNPATNPGTRHPCPTSSSSHVRPGNQSLGCGQPPPHPNIRQHWKRSSPVPPEHGKLSETSLKALEHTQRLSRLSFAPFCFTQESNPHATGFGASDQYPSSACFVAPEVKPDSSFANHDTFRSSHDTFRPSHDTFRPSIDTFRPSQHATQSGPFPEIPFSHDYLQSIPGMKALTLQNQPSNDPVAGPSHGNYQDDKPTYNLQNFSDAGMAHQISSQVDHSPGPDQKRPRKRRITEKRREQNRAHQKAFRLRRDLFLKHKDTEINDLEERLNHYKTINKEQHEIITNLKAKLSSVDQNMRPERNYTNAAPTIVGSYPQEGLHYGEGSEAMNINDRPILMPSESSALEWALKSSEDEMPSMHHQSEDSNFPWSSTSSIYVPEHIFNPNLTEEHQPPSHQQFYPNSK